MEDGNGGWEWEEKVETDVKSDLDMLYVPTCLPHVTFLHHQRGMNVLMSWQRKLFKMRRVGRPTNINIEINIQR